MNSQSKRCPVCHGAGKIPWTINSAPKVCAACEGSGRDNTPDPTTAGSETPAGPSRRRSLPVPVEVLDTVKALVQESDKLKAILLAKERHELLGHWLGVHGELVKLVIALPELFDEAPEGNTELSSGL